MARRGALADVQARHAATAPCPGTATRLSRDPARCARPAARIGAPAAAPTGVGLDELTPRERALLALICRGPDDKSMARALDVTDNTVRNQVARLYAKIAVNRRNAAAAWARARDVVALKDAAA